MARSGSYQAGALASERGALTMLTNRRAAQFRSREGLEKQRTTDVQGRVTLA